MENTSIFHQLCFDSEVSGFELEWIKLSIQAQTLKGVIRISVRKVVLKI